MYNTFQLSGLCGGWGGWGLVSCVQSWELGLRAHLTFRGLSCWAVGEGRACGLCRRSRARRMCATRLLGFILPGGFSGALLVVSILGMIYDCCLQLLLRSWGGGGVLMVPVGAIGPFWPGDGLFRALCVCLCVCVFVGLEAVSKVESSVRVHTSSSEVYPAGKLQ